MDSENTIDLKNLPEKPQEPYVETTASGIPNALAWEARHTLPEHARWKHLIALILIVSAGLVDVFVNCTNCPSTGFFGSSVKFAVGD